MVHLFNLNSREEGTKSDFPSFSKGSRAKSRRGWERELETACVWDLEYIMGFFYEAWLFTSRIDFRKSKNFYFLSESLLKELPNIKSLYLKINSIKIITI